jgi:hypothetical protein
VSGDYLWDGSGEPDPEVLRLEAALGRLRGTRPPPELPARPSGRAFPPGRWTALAAAAAVALALVPVVGRSPVPETGAAAAGWGLAWLEGPSWPEARVVREGRLAVGEWIDTRAGRARLSVGDVGEVELEPATRVGLLDAGQRSHRLSLARGVMHATIWAPPRRFLVDTPSAVAVDLGCRYTLEVRDDGTGVLRVEAGWVGFEHGQTRALVPAGAVCDTGRGTGPGTPHYEDASPAFSAALDVIDFGEAGDARRTALDVVLAGARERDALSLWHLVSRLAEGERSRVHDRLAALVPPPPGVTREGILRGDRAMLDAWWEGLGLGSADFWRDWTAPWPPTADASR